MEDKTTDKDIGQEQPIEKMESDEVQTKSDSMEELTENTDSSEKITETEEKSEPFTVASESTSGKLFWINMPDELLEDSTECSSDMSTKLTTTEEGIEGCKRDETPSNVTEPEEKLIEIDADLGKRKRDLAWKYLPDHEIEESSTECSSDMSTKLTTTEEGIEGSKRDETPNVTEPEEKLIKIDADLGKRGLVWKYLPDDEIEDSSPECSSDMSTKLTTTEEGIEDSKRDETPSNVTEPEEKLIEKDADLGKRKRVLVWKYLPDDEIEKSSIECSSDLSTKLNTTEEGIKGRKSDETPSNVTEPEEKLIEKDADLGKRKRDLVWKYLPDDEIEESSTECSGDMSTKPTTTEEVIEGSLANYLELSDNQDQVSDNSENEALTQQVAVTEDDQEKLLCVKESGENQIREDEND